MFKFLCQSDRPIVFSLRCDRLALSELLCFCSPKNIFISFLLSPSPTPPLSHSPTLPLSPSTQIA
ncbi:hypothetical protein LAY57_24365 [Argonema antarcticum A004/B2]|nr:hypothetical protein [Argonema antarcticum A004/B2]